MNEGDRPEAITVLVVDDHDLFRTGLASLLAAQPGIEVVAQASGGRTAVRLAAELQPDVILMDVQMPNLDGPAATRKILSQRASSRVVALTVLADDAAVAEALEAGSCGFLAKDTPIDGIVAAIRAAAQGAAWLSPRAAKLVLDQMRRNGTDHETGEG
jgi:DNA-binding NarL/FixJ family response regulator